MPGRVQDSSNRLWRRISPPPSRCGQLGVAPQPLRLLHRPSRPVGRSTGTCAIPSHAPAVSEEHAQRVDRRPRRRPTGAGRAGPARPTAGRGRAAARSAAGPGTTTLTTASSMSGRDWSRTMTSRPARSAAAYAAPHVVGHVAGAPGRRVARCVGGRPGSGRSHGCSATRTVANQRTRLRVVDPVAGRGRPAGRATAGRNWLTSVSARQQRHPRVQVRAEADQDVLGRPVDRAGTPPRTSGRRGRR